jgi:hypothetical protein
MWKSVDRALGGNPDSNGVTTKSRHRTRELTNSVLPIGFSFIMGLIT